MKLITGIYKITSPSGRIYIGQSIDVKKRWMFYKKPSFLNYRSNQTKLKNSLSKYGPENHIFEVIEECDVSDLNNRERYWQDYYDVLGKNGLNCILTKSDDKRRVITDELRFKIGKANRGKKYTKEQREAISKSFTEESRKKISLGAKKRIGIKQTEDHIRKRVKYHIGSKRSRQSCENISYGLNHIKKKVYQFDLNMNIIKIYKSLSQVKKENGFDISSISKVCRLKQKTSYGFIWRYEECLDQANYLKRAILEIENKYD